MDILLQYCMFFDLSDGNYVYWKVKLKFFLFSIFLSLFLLYPHNFLSPRPQIILIYGLLTSDTKFHTPENKMGKMQSVPEYTNLPRVLHAGKNDTIINKKKKAWYLSY
jgi:hypothetical protein